MGNPVRGTFGEGSHMGSEVLLRPVFSLYGLTLLRVHLGALGFGESGFSVWTRRVLARHCRRAACSTRCARALVPFTAACASLRWAWVSRGSLCGRALVFSRATAGPANHTG